MAQRPDIQYIRFYTDGSAARQIAVRQPMETIRMPRVKKQKRRTVCIDPVAIASIVMAVVMTVLIVVGFVRLNVAKEETAALERHLVTLQEENALLEQTHKDSYDLEQIERMALALGMIHKDDAQQVVLTTDPPAQDTQMGIWQKVYAFLTGSLA